MNLKAKRADLCAEMERLIGHVNRTNGAIALLDDLIAEEEAESRTAASAACYRAVALTPAPSENPDWQPPAGKEMLPVDRYVAPEGDAA